MEENSITVYNSVDFFQDTPCTTAWQRRTDCKHRIRDNPSFRMIHFENIVNLFLIIKTFQS